MNQPFFNVVDESDPLVKVHTRADELLKLYGLYEQGWRFELAKDIHTVGWCKHNEKIIQVSYQYLHNHWDEIEDTLRHEIAHALVGPNHGHDMVWKSMAVTVGARPERCAPAGVKAAAKPNYVMKCPGCGRKWYRFRMRKANFRARCPQCLVHLEIYKIRKENQA